MVFLPAPRSPLTELGIEPDGARCEFTNNTEPLSLLDCVCPVKLL
jgi:hypothetical protein